MVEEKIDLLMEKLSQNQQEMDAKLTSAITEVKREVTSAQLAQERTAQELHIAENLRTILPVPEEGK